MDDSDRIGADLLETLRLLHHMRELHVSARRKALVDRDLVAFRQNQSDVETVDRAIADEVRLSQDWVEAEAARLRQGRSGEGPASASPPASDAP